MVHITVYIFITYYFQKVSIYYKKNIVWTKFIKYIFIMKLKHTAWNLLILSNSIILQKRRQTESLKLAKSRRTWRISRILGSHPPLMVVDLRSPFLSFPTNNYCLYNWKKHKNTMLNSHHGEKKKSYNRSIPCASTRWHITTLFFIISLILTIRNASRKSKVK